jgi:hypothetical protein
LGEGGTNGSAPFRVKHYLRHRQTKMAAATKAMMTMMAVSTDMVRGLPQSGNRRCALPRSAAGVTAAASFAATLTRLDTAS